MSHRPAPSLRGRTIDRSPSASSSRSPSSLWTVVASSTSGSDHITHVRTQVPYALVTAGGAAVLFVLFGFLLPEGFRIIPY
ncbi:Na+/H+ antiporter NhaC family protein [Halorubellus salinus]|uniref:Na+/H+ antiporter NhaC family protein n=1 Tax=Halorubellus salinus TaxID=755309 RepID=UPI001D0949C0|nr:Na+/H+ antiporter NhaC family protein [Halorubellus salinus]